MPGDAPVYHNMLPPNELTTECGGDLQKTGIVTASWAESTFSYVLWQGAEKQW